MMISGYSRYVSFGSSIYLEVELISGDRLDKDAEQDGGRADIWNSMSGGRVRHLEVELDI